MRSTKIKRILLVGAAVLGVLSIFGATFFVRNATSHAAAPANFLPHSAFSTVKPQYGNVGPKGPQANKHSQNGLIDQCANGVFDTIPSFCGTYSVNGFDGSGNHTSTWYTNTVGNSPKQNGPGTTTINAPIIPVKVNLLNPNGSVYHTLDPLADVNAFQNSPVFQYAKYSSGPAPTQWADAVSRAEFFNQEKNGWHTLLNPILEPEYTMNIPAGSWSGFLNSDGSCCIIFTVDANTFQSLLFPPSTPDNSTVLGNAEVTGEITPQDITTTLFDNTYLYLNGDPAQCCVLGFHTFDFEAPGPSSPPNVAGRAYVMNYSSYITPGIFNGGLADVSALSHEMSELYNDPFVTAVNPLDVTPWWLAPNGNCQNDLETGDVIENLPNGIFPMTLHGVTYHPQNEALIQWFESGGTSPDIGKAIDGAYSYPNETVLPTPNVSQQPGCTGPA